MLSISIPVYNFDVTRLVTELHKQIISLNKKGEIILIDDASTQKYQTICKELSSLNHVKYIQLEKNVGRSKIRNMFLEYASYDNLLFLDCDSYVTKINFLETYIDFIKKNDYIIAYGGRYYEKKQAKRNRMLNWKYGFINENRPAEERSKFPNKSFMTNNFIVKKSILDKIKFDESLSGYGHEDTLFGYVLKKKEIKIFHLDNSVLNGDVEANKEYLRKTEEGINNLVKIVNKLNFDKDFIKDVKILSFYFKLKKKKIILPFKSAFFILKPILHYVLIKGYISLSLFNFYKLGILIKAFKINAK